MGLIVCATGEKQAITFRASLLIAGFWVTEAENFVEMGDGCDGGEA